MGHVTPCCPNHRYILISQYSWLHWIWILLIVWYYIWPIKTEISWTVWYLCKLCWPYLCSRQITLLFWCQYLWWTLWICHGDFFRYKSPFPEINAHCHDEPVANYAVYYDTPSIGDIYTSDQLFFVTKSIVLYVYGMKTDKQFLNRLEDNI